jgi:NhaP-type Na+/H+ or K+/H+ antiporter
MNDFNLITALLGASVLLLGLGSKRLAASPVPPSLIALAVGVGVGPGALNLIDLDALGDRATVLEHAARLALGIGLVGVALRVPSEYPRRNWRAMLILIGLGVPLMWTISTALVYLILGLPFWVAALIGAIITPTDPVVASAIVTGATAEENIPDRVRHAISFDSGANDGLAYLCVFLPILMLTGPADEALVHWLLDTLLWEVGTATLLGLLVGYAAGKFLRKAEDADTIESDWRLVYTVALGFLVIGLGRLIHSDEVLAVFAAAVAFDQVVSAPDRLNEEQGQEAVNRFFAIPILILLGTAIPWDGWRALGWHGVLLAVAVLLLRRPVTLLLLRPFLPGLRRAGDVLLAGWFGPIAVSAVYYASLAEHRLSVSVVWDVVSLTACTSIVAHGISAAPLTRLYGKVAGKKRAPRRARKQGQGA